MESGVLGVMKVGRMRRRRREEGHRCLGEIGRVV